MCVCVLACLDMRGVGCVRDGHARPKRNYANRDWRAPFFGCIFLYFWINERKPAKLL